MNIREKMEAFWAGERPEHIPYAIYDWEWRTTDAKDPAWQKMFNDGLGLIRHMYIIKTENRNMENLTQTYTENGNVIKKEIMRTPIGEVYQTYVNDWHHKYWIETAEDYKVMTYIVEHSDIIPCFEEYINEEKNLPFYEIPVVFMHRTPLQVILVDYVGLENFAYHLYDYEDEMMELHDALLKKFRRKVQLAAEGPGKCLKFLENFTAETMGPNRFNDFHMKIYNEAFPILQSAGKVVATHYDGKLSSCKELIAKAPINIIESLTEPPEGDMNYDECRAIWPDKLFWGNINVGLYELPKYEFKKSIHELVRKAAPDGRRLAFEVSEQIPHNWKESMPIVLEALNEI